MGLGKTVQAIPACALLREQRNIARVLVICPASLKTEWEEQIQLFSGLAATTVFGDRNERRRLYRDGEFFTLCNYEQVRADGDELISLARPAFLVGDAVRRQRRHHQHAIAAFACEDLIERRTVPTTTSGPTRRTR